MRNGDRVVATPHIRNETDLAALAEAVLLMLATQTAATPNDPVAVAQEQAPVDVECTSADAAEPAA